MTITASGRTGIARFSLVFVAVVIIASGCQGPPGPAGPAGPPGSGGGPPYVWICTPAHFPNSGATSRADVYIHNASALTANVTVNILDKSGNNLTGIAVPGSPGTNYPGDAAPVALAAANTRDFEWLMSTSSGPPFTNVAFSVRVTSDQPVVVGSNFQFAGNMPNQCSLAPK